MSSYAISESIAKNTPGGKHRLVESAFNRLAESQVHLLVASEIRPKEGRIFHHLGVSTEYPPMFY